MKYRIAIILINTVLAGLGGYLIAYGKDGEGLLLFTMTVIVMTLIPQEKS